MRYLTALLISLSCWQYAGAQTVSAMPPKPKTVDTFTTTFIPHSFTGSISFGFIDQYRTDLHFPAGFEKGNISGFVPIYGRAEYALSRHMGIGATIIYDEFYNNYYQLYTGNGKEFKRSRTDMTTIYSGGLSLNYHFGDIIPIKKLDVFISAGFLLNNIHHTALPQGDSTVAEKDRTGSAMLRAGARYYISSKSAFMLDAGLDKHSVFTLGYSFRFIKRH